MTILPGSNGKQKIVVRNHDTMDIVALLVQQDGHYQDQVNEYCKKLRGKSVHDACQYIYTTLRENVKYKPDRAIEQNLKSPARLFHDGFGDCKSFSLFIGSCLKELHIPYVYRFVSFANDRTPTHVYVVAAPGTRDETIIDGVLSKFDYEKPYKYKKDIAMPLSMLTGMPTTERYYPGQVGFLKKLRKKAENLVHKVEHAASDDMHKAAAAITKDAQKIEHGVEKDVKKAAQTVKKGVDAVVKIVKTADPAFILIRSGMLGMLYVNMFNSAGKLTLGLLTPQEAQARGYDMNEWNKLKRHVDKFRSDFVHVYGAPNDVNLVNAIKHGKMSGVQQHYIGQEPVSSSAAIAAAIPLVLALVKLIDKDVDTNKMTKNAKQGSAEQLAKKKPTITAEQLAGLGIGVTKLLNGEDDSDNPHLQNALDQVGLPQDQRPVSAKSKISPVLLIGGLAVAALVLTKK